MAGVIDVEELQTGLDFLQSAIPQERKEVSLETLTDEERKKIMNAYDPTHKLKKENISKFVSFNQNGGWFDDGKAACKATSLAILASINSGTVVKPT